MAERVCEYEFSVGELNGLEKVRAFVAGGSHYDAIGYRPSDPDLFTSILLFQSFPDRVEPPAVEEPFNPRDRIIELTHSLDKRIMTHSHRRPRYDNSYGVRGVKLADGRFLNFQRSIFEDKLNIVVEHIIDTRDVYPRIESEKFDLSEDGYFVRTAYERVSPTGPCDVRAVAGYNPYNPDFDKNTADSLKFFSELVRPFLETERPQI